MQSLRITLEVNNFNKNMKLKTFLYFFFYMSIDYEPIDRHT